MSSWLLFGIELAATISFAISGLVEGWRRKMDVVGLATVGFLTAFGGGTLRDLLLDKRPFFWVEHSEFLWLVLALALGAGWVMRLVRSGMADRTLIAADVLGLGLFTAAGATQGLAAGMPALVAALLAVVTATFGGVLRDIVCNEIPTLFKDHRPYAICSFAGAWALIGLDKIGVPQPLPWLVCVVVVVGFRLLALYRGWRLHEVHRAAPSATTRDRQ